MPRKVNVDNLVGAQEIADLLGVARPQVIHEWRRRHPDFPAPVAQLGGAGKRSAFHVWNWPDVERWARATGRYPVKGDQ